MSEPVAGPLIPASPTPAASGSPQGSAGAPTRPTPTIPDHELLQPIGRGAYGEVWLARSVVGTLRAVKVVYRQDFGDSQPFDREFKGIQKFEPVSRSHDGLIDILQIGRNEAEGYFYYVMELADSAAETRHQKSDASGQKSADGLLTSDLCLLSSQVYRPRTLRQDLRTGGRLRLDECLRIGLGLTSGLEHLHKQGLVHRDIKPSNIIFVNGQPKLADIGLVAAIDDARSMVGTAGYIPPEGPGTPRADLYSLGKVLYEAAFGKDRQEFPQLPVELRNEPDHPQLLELNAVILRACESDPKQRYASAGDMAGDLERLQQGESIRTRQAVQRAVRAVKRTLPWAALLGVLGAVFVNLGLHNSRQGAVPTDIASVFVLPFRNDGTNGIDDDLRGRITDAFIDSLAAIDGVRRSPRKSGWVHQDEDELRRSLARTNNMRHVLTGRVGGRGDALILGVRLYVRGKDQPLWSEYFSGSTNEVVDLERRALARIASTLGLRVTEAEQQRIDQLLTNNLEALGWMRKAEALYHKEGGTQAGYLEVQTLAQKALDFDPAYLDAEFKDVEVLRDLALDRAPRESWRSIGVRLENILKQDDTHAGALDQMGGYLLSFARDWVALQSVVEGELAARDPQSRDWLGAMWYRTFGWFEEARTCQERSEHPAPTASVQLFHAAASRRAERRFAEGAQMSRRMLELYPGNPWGYLSLAHCLVANGEFEAGLEAAETTQGFQRQQMTALRGYAYAKMGQPHKAREVLAELLDLGSSGQYVQPYFVARVYAALGENEKALDWLEKADADKSEYLLFVDMGGLRTDPAWDGLQDKPRFWQLCDRLGLGKNQWPRPKPAALK